MKEGDKSLMTDKELLKKLKKDKNSGLSVAIKLYSGLLYKIAAAVILPVGTKEDVEECVSDSFLRFFGEIDNLDLEKASIKSYLALITRRRAIDFYRRLRQDKEHISQSTEDTDLPSGDFTLNLERKQLLFSAVKNLGEPDTTIITRKYLLGETASQIARELNMSEAAVQKRLERSREKLKAELGGVF